MASPFAPLALSSTETQTLEQLSRKILSNYVAQYEAFERERKSSSLGLSSADERLWKPVKQREDVRVFARRKDDTALELIPDSDALSSSSQDLPALLAVGSVVGNLDDLMYGLVSPNVDVMRVKSAYLDDHFADAAVLETIALPSRAEPFQSLVVKWAANRQGTVLRQLMRNRDFVFLERSGIAHTSTGERVGFHLLHSVQFPQTHELPPYERGTLSVCGIYRNTKSRSRSSSGGGGGGDSAPGTVQIYVRGILDPRGNVLRPVILSAAADMFVIVHKYVECAYRKKLMWRLRMHQRTRALRRDTDSEQPSATTSSSSSSSSSAAAAATESSRQCVVCSRPPTRTLSALRAGSSASSSSERQTCALCQQFVCASCRIKKTLSYVAREQRLVHREFAFCTACFTETCRLSAFEVAQQELALPSAAAEDDSFDFDEGSGFTFGFRRNSQALRE